MTKQVSAYALKPGKAGPRLPRASREETREFGIRREAAPNGQLSSRIFGRKVEVRDLTFLLLMTTRRPVIDQTALQGEFSFEFDFAPFDSDALASSTGASLFTALEEQLGLRLETVRIPLEGLVIDSIEHPREN